jgi:predicted tellurium resistance membrane protein TerC
MWHVATRGKAMTAISDNVLFSLAALVSACVVLASGYLCYLSPVRRWPYLLAIGVVCVAWIARQLIGGAGNANPKASAARRKLTQAIISSGVLLAMALGGVLISRLG